MDMLLWGLTLIGAAALLLAIELFVPSAGLLMILSVTAAVAGVVCLWRYDAVWGICGTIGVMIAGPVMFFAGLRIWRNTPIGRRMIGAPTDEARLASAQAIERERLARASLVGADGVAITDLRPVGIVELRGERLDALSDGFMITAGTRVRVVAVDGTQVKVRATA